MARARVLITMSNAERIPADQAQKIANRLLELLHPYTESAVNNPLGYKTWQQKSAGDDWRSFVYPLYPCERVSQILN